MFAMISQRRRNCSLQWHLERGHLPGNIPWILPGISQDLVPFSLGCDTLEVGKTPWSLSHQQGETHETLSVYHRSATATLPPAGQRLAPGLAPPAPAPRRLLRSLRATSPRAAVPPSHRKPDPQKK